MIKKFESFSRDLTEDIRDYFNGILDSSEEIEMGIKYNEESELWRVRLEGPTQILENDPELKFLDKIYLELRGEEKDMIDNIALYGSDLSQVRSNPFFQRMFKASNLFLVDIEIYAGGYLFEIGMHFKEF